MYVIWTGISCTAKAFLSRRVIIRWAGNPSNSTTQIKQHQAVIFSRTPWAVTLTDIERELHAMLSLQLLGVLLHYSNSFPRFTSIQWCRLNMPSWVCVTFSLFSQHIFTTFCIIPSYKMMDGRVKVWQQLFLSLCFAFETLRGREKIIRFWHAPEDGD